MKQVFHNKGSTVDERGARQRTWLERLYEFDGTKLQQFPIPERALDEPLARLTRWLVELAAMHAPQSSDSSDRQARHWPTPVLEAAVEHDERIARE